MSDDEQKPVPPVEITGGVARVLLDLKDVPAFQDWQRLTQEEKQALIWMAKNHPSLMRLVRLEIWAGHSVAGIIRLGAVAAAIIAIMSAINLWKGD